jgi:hypothetical protein
MDDSTDKVIKAVTRWLEYRQRYGMYPDRAHRFAVDLAHSPLFQRILEGKTVYPDPPPVSHSYPWYDLVETGEGEPITVFEDGHGFGGKKGEHLCINQNMWKIVEKRGPEEWVVQYYMPDAEAISKLSDDEARFKRPQKLHPSKWLVTCTGQRPGWEKKPQDSFSKFWKISRLPEE